jgi:hypothetical protein
VTIVVDEHVLGNLEEKTNVNNKRNTSIKDNTCGALTVSLENSVPDRLAEEPLRVLAWITKPHFFGALGRSTYDRPRKQELSGCLR